MDGWPYPNMSDPGGRNRVSFHNLCCSFEVFALHGFKASQGWTFGAHAHPMFEVNYMVEGVQHVTLERDDVHLHAGDLMLMPPGMLHGAGAGNDGFTCLCFCFDTDFPYVRDALIRSDKLLHVKATEVTESVRVPLDRLFDIAIRDGSYPAQPLHISAQFHLFLAALAETEFAENRAEPAITPAMRMQAAVMAEAILHLVMDHARTVSDRVHLEDIAKQECMSLSHCTRIFRAVYGMSPRDFLSMIRQREAKKLLLTPSLPIGDVARRIGYANDSDFSRQFKRWTGMSPRAFQQEACMGFSDSRSKATINP